MLLLSVFRSTSCIKNNVRRCSSRSVGERAYDLRKSMEEKEKGMGTLLSHAGSVENKSSESNAPLMAGIEVSSTFERPASGVYGAEDQIYSRTHNATRSLLEKTMAALEGDPSATCVSFSSGMAAVSAVLLSNPGALAVLPEDVYHGVPTQLEAVMQRHGIRYTVADMSDLESLQQLILQQEACHVILWAETPSNPRMNLLDIRRLRNVADHAMSLDQTKQVLLIVDSTLAPPPITQPLLLGAHGVLHSATKYLGGHSDLLLGLVTASSTSPIARSLASDIRTIQATIGATPSPFDAWLALRGLRTLHLRIQRQSATAHAIAQFLQSHPSVTKVYYPAFHPEFNPSQMKSHGAMLSFELVEGEPMATAVAAAVKIIRRATSLGGTESLIEHRASIEPEDRVVSPPSLLRLSVGLEDPEDLIEDLRIALDVASSVLGL